MMNRSRKSAQTRKTRQDDLSSLFGFNHNEGIVISLLQEQNIMALKVIKETLKLGSKGHTSLGVIRLKHSEPSWVPEDPETHTGQKFDKNDYRLARFIDKKKHVNKQFAIDLIASVPPQPRKERVVFCDGGGGPLGHPKVFINLDKPGNHSCGYCGLRFYKEDHHDH